MYFPFVDLDALSWPLRLWPASITVPKVTLVPYESYPVSPTLTKSVVNVFTSVIMLYGNIVDLVYHIIMHPHKIVNSIKPTSNVPKTDASHVPLIVFLHEIFRRLRTLCTLKFPGLGV